MMRKSAFSLTVTSRRTLTPKTKQSLQNGRNADDSAYWQY
jgi:hypothetical protein